MDAGRGPGPLTIPLAKAVEPTGEVVALDGQCAKLEHRIRKVEWTFGRGGEYYPAYDSTTLKSAVTERGIPKPPRYLPKGEGSPMRGKAYRTLWQSLERLPPAR